MPRRRWALVRSGLGPVGLTMCVARARDRYSLCRSNRPPDHVRILHVTPYWADAWAYGGIPRVAGALATHLAAAGHLVTVCTTDAHSRDSRRPAGATDDAQGIDLRVFPNRSNRLAYD